MTKSRKRILLSSIAMLLVALVALGSATFAWFSVSKTVTADGINVKAIAAAGIEISKTSATTGYENTVSFGQSASGTNYALQPVSWVPAITKSTNAFGSFTNNGFIPNSNIADGGVAPYTGAAWTDTTDKPANSTNKSTKGFFATYQVWIRSKIEGTGATASRTGHAIDAKVTIGGQDDDFVRAYLVDMTTADNSKVYADSNAAFGAATATNAAAASNNVTGVLASGTATTVTGTPAVASGASDSADAGVPYLLVVWFDGQDADCVDTAQNHTADFTIEFTATDM